MKLILSVEPIRFPLTGIGRYTWELAQQFRTAQELESLTFFSGRHLMKDLPQPNSKAGGGHKLKRWVQQSHLASECYRLMMPWLKKHALRNEGDFLYHGPNFFLPPFPGKTIATFHDLSPFTWPNCNTPQRIRYMQKESLKSIKHANALIVDAYYTRQELANYFSYPLEQIHVAPLAASKDFCQRDVFQTQSLLEQYHLSHGEYAFYAGTIEPRKNLLNLLAAYELLPLTMRRQYPLILAGYQGWCSEEIHQRIIQAERAGWARYLGYVPADHLPVLYSAARVFVFPSLYEGFGLPVLEAMQSGVPVVCSNAATLPEVVGEAALMSHPEDVDMLSEAIIRALQDDQWRDMAIHAGLQRAQLFSWEKCAFDTLAAYRKVWES